MRSGWDDARPFTEGDLDAFDFAFRDQIRRL